MSEFIRAKEFENEGRQLEAVDAYFKAVMSFPHNSEYCSAFAHSIRFLSFNEVNPFLLHALLHCFTMPEVNFQDLAVPGFSLLALHPDYLTLVEAFEKKEPLLPLLLDSNFNENTLLLALLTHTIVPDPQYERLMTALREALLKQTEDLSPFLPFLLALAAQCFLNEYVFSETEEEADLIAARSQQLHFPLTPTASPLIALLASYRPLYHYSFSTSLLTHTDPRLSSLIQTQLIEPQEERSLITTIPILTPIHNSISKKVQEQYEENPYPRWNYISQRIPQDTTQVLQERFPNEVIIPQLDAPQILIAGCGTGRQAIQAALTYKDAEILAIDLSAASLAYAKRKAEERGLNQITFMQADLLNLPSHVKQFDIIEAVGVLHHLEDPMTGWKVLRRHLKEGGWMNLGLYSEIGRQDVCAARTYIEQKGYLPTIKGIRLCRQELLNLPENDSLKDVTLSIDFYTTSACRDLIFHAQEHRFTIPQIIDCLQQLELTFLGFDLPQQELLKEYHQENPNDPPEGTLSHWDQFEKKHPTTFIGMYQFWTKPDKSTYDTNNF